MVGSFLHTSRGNAHISTRCVEGMNHCGPGPDRDVVSDCDAINDRRTRAEENPISQPATSCKYRVHRDMHEIAHSAVVLHDRTGINDRALPDCRQRAYMRMVRDEAASANPCPCADCGSRGNQCAK